jgi:hypothetical protein
MTSARIRKNLSLEEILVETCADALSDVLSESYVDDDIDSESYRDLSLKLQGK